MSDEPSVDRAPDGSEAGGAVTRAGRDAVVGLAALPVTQAHTIVPDLVTPLIAWYAEFARDLPWRRPDFGAWGVLVSEFMLQQTPVNRVVPHLEAWLERWPTPASLAAEAPAEVVR
jgi:hypothetical protein